MAQANHKYGGDGSIIKVFNSAGALAAGDVVVIGNRIGVVSGSKAVAVGDDYTLQTAGVFEMDVLGTDVPAAGALLYWDDGNNRLTTTASTHKSAGIALTTKGSGPTRMLLDINANCATITI